MISLSIITLLISFQTSFAVNPKEDTLQFIDYKNPFWDEVVKSSDDFNVKPKEEHSTLKMDFKGKDLPKFEDFTQFWHNDPVPQAWTNICWDFCGTSLFESEVYRLHKKKVKLSEPWVAYWEFIEKAKMFIKTRGESLFAEGSQANAVKRIYQEYGVVPRSVYTGFLKGQTYLDHHVMFREMRNYLESCKENSAWNEELILYTLKDIMNHYMLTPPEKFTYEGKEYTPKTFLNDYLQLTLDDYVDIISLLEPGYWKIVSYDVPDNWWHEQSYHNVPLDLFMKTLESAVKAGYTAAIGGDVSEPGMYAFEDVAMIPTWDIPHDYINDKARQFRFSNNTTTDDHGIHIVGYTVKNGEMWYLIKDSGSSSRNGNAKGYYFYHSDYIKLKIMTYTIHKDAVKDILNKY
ncbi:MAG: peptidase C1 [Ignavibacteria bacterium GWF2_33_9]|nr:MAG: peptidase C1 [Ignavibacteria bacterium GWF2_33_9]